MNRKVPDTFAVGNAQYGDYMRIMVTNDDGIDSVGLHVLAKALVPLGEVVVVAPDSEYSGAGASLGALHLIRPEVHRLALDSFPTMTGVSEIWSVSGPPALCVMFARLSVFGPKPDIVVSGINPGANVGRAVYHSGTVGAALTARSGGITGVAISQDVAAGSFDGQGLESMLSKQQWHSAAKIGVEVVRALIESPPTDPVVYNVNVPNCAVEEMRGWRSTEVGTLPPRTMGSAHLEPKPGHEGAFRVSMVWGDANDLPDHLDGGAVVAGWVSVSTLSTIKSDSEHPPVNEVLHRLFAARS